MIPDIEQFLCGTAFEEVSGGEENISVSAFALKLGNLFFQVCALHFPAGIVVGPRLLCLLKGQPHVKVNFVSLFFPVFPFTKKKIQAVREHRRVAAFPPLVGPVDLRDDVVDVPFL